MQLNLFLDGNKRMAFASAAAILRLEGFEVVASDDDAVRFMLEMAANKLTLAHVSAWLKDRPRVGIGKNALRMKGKHEDRLESEEEAKRRAIEETLETQKALMKKLSKL